MPQKAQLRRKPGPRPKAKSKPTKSNDVASVPLAIQGIIAQLKQHADEFIVRDMSERYGITITDASRCFGVRVATLQEMAKVIRKERGRDHDLAAALWKSGYYECRMIACFIDDSAQVTAAQMDRWCRDFDNWAICDTACFHLFDRTGVDKVMPQVEKWCKARPEFVKRAAFALLASLALHDKKAPDGPFVRGLEVIEAHASDDRNFVKKAVSWALRGIGKRKGGALHGRATEVAKRLAQSDHPACRWIGKDALRDLSRHGAKVPKT